MEPRERLDAAAAEEANIERVRQPVNGMPVEDDKIAKSSCNSSQK
jgi:hypothetical protein